MSININVTIDEMLKLHGNNAWVEGYSRDAQLTILKEYEKYQREATEDGIAPKDFIRWEEFFIDATEIEKNDIEYLQCEIDMYHNHIKLDNGNLLCLVHW